MRSLITRIKNVQQGIGTLADGKPGPSTYNTFEKYLYSEGLVDLRFPYESKEFGCVTITGKPERLSVKSTKGKHSVSTFPYSMSGSFTYPSGVNPNAIMINGGSVIHSYSSHHWAGYPETVLYYTQSGKHGKKLIHNASELPEDTLWAIGGYDLNDLTMGEKEGFAKFSKLLNGKTKWFDYRDVYRYTKHNAIGFDKYGNIVGVFHKACTSASLQKRCEDIGLVDMIGLDGGSVSAINGGSLKYNTHLKQGFLIQF
jgi:hypothetical protein